jgi:hypothetical protein
MDHATAVRVARNGEGAVVAELLRLSHELQEANERIERLTELYEDIQRLTELYEELGEQTRK